MKRDIPTGWPKHKDKMITPDQLKSLQAQYNALRRDGDSRVFISLHARGLDERQQRIKWMNLKLGGPAEKASFKELNFNEACYLLDLVFCQPSKLDQKIDAELKRLQIVEPAAYFESSVKGRRSEAKWGFGGRSFNDLTRDDKIKLVSILVTRSPKK